MKLLGVKSWLTPFLVCFVGPGTCCCNPTGAPQTRAQRNLRFGHPPHSVPLVFPFALLAVPVLLLCSFGACFLFCFSHSHHHTDRHTHPHTDRHTHTHTHRHTHTHTHTDRHTHTHTHTHSTQLNLLYCWLGLHFCLQLWYAMGNGFSGQILFERWTIATYNVAFTLLPPVAIGIFDQHLSAETLLAVRAIVFSFLRRGGEGGGRQGGKGLLMVIGNGCSHWCWLLRG